MFSNTARDPAQARQIRQGFMLATTERDGHPGQESDGHLGGLDVYVEIVEEPGDGATALQRIASQGMTDIVAAFGFDPSFRDVWRRLDEQAIVLVLPVQTPFAQSSRPEVAAFISAYAKAYGYPPTIPAADGYHAARRIDAAVRAQGGVQDAVLLTARLEGNARDFTW